MKTSENWLPIFNYFELYHGFEVIEDQDCEHKQIETECEAFNMLQDQKCMIYIEYDTCNVKSFVCESSTFEEGRYTPVEDCSQ